jgi:hypothetical protein
MCGFRSIACGRFSVFGFACAISYFPFPICYLLFALLLALARPKSQADLLAHTPYGIWHMGHRLFPFPFLKWQWQRQRHRVRGFAYTRSA